MTISAPTSARLDDTISLTATLRDSGNNPVVGAPVSFGFDSQGIGSATTDSSGVATLSYKLATNAGSHVVTASYAGSNTYTPSTAKSALTVSPWKLIITSAVTQAPLIRLKGVDYTTDVSGKVVISVNSTSVVNLQVNDFLVTTNGTRAVFVQWGDGTTTNPRSINVNTDVTLSVTTKFQYYLTVTSPYATPNGAGWYDSGSTAKFSVQSPVDQGNNTRRVFIGWLKGGSPVSNSTNGSLQMSAPATLSASWKKQYYLTIVSQYGSPSGAGWYDVATTVSGSIQSPFPTTNGTRFIATGYVGTGTAPQSGTGTSVSFTLSAPAALTFQWKAQYFIQVNTPYSNATGAGWYDSGTQATVSIKETSVSLNPLVSKVFSGWTGDATATSRSIVVMMDGPKQLTATWSDNYTNVYIAAGGVAAVVVAGLSYFIRIRSRKPR